MVCFHRLHRNRRSAYLNIHFYVSILTIFYLLVPALLGISLDYSLGYFQLDTHVQANTLCFYFSSTILISYLFSKDKEFVCDRIEKYKFTQSIILIRYLILMIAVYVVIVLFLHIQEILSAQSRAVKSALITEIEARYKIKALFVILVLLVSYLAVEKRKLSCLYPLIPYIVFDLLLSDRSYIFGAFVIFFLISAFIYKPLKVRTGVVFVGLVLSIAVFRNPEAFKLYHLLHLLGEFVNTWSTLLLTIESDTKHSLLESVTFFLLRAFPFSPYEQLFGEYQSWTVIPADNKSVGYGLAGSILGEVASFQNLAASAIFPLAFTIYLQIINKLLYSYTIFGFLVFIITVLYLQQIFRYSFFEIGLYPFYVVIFYGFFLTAPKIIISIRKS